MTKRSSHPPTPTRVFFAGKGGVGKSTCCVALAAHLVGTGASVRVVSLDRAHSLSTLTGALMEALRRREMGENLEIHEPHFDELASSWLGGLSREIRQRYRYLAPLNLESFADVVRWSPGVHEHLVAQVLADDLIRGSESRVPLLVDLPATASFHNLINYVLSAEKWTQALRKLQNRIRRSERWASKVHDTAALSREDDSPGGEPRGRLDSRRELDEKLDELGGRFQGIRRALTSASSAFVAVVNPDELSREEILEGGAVLRRLGTGFRLVVNNRSEPQGGSILEFAKRITSPIAALSWPRARGLAGGDPDELATLGAAVWARLSSGKQERGSRGGEPGEAAR